MRFKTLLLPPAAPAPASAQTAVADAKGIWMTYHNFVRQSVADIPEDKYSFKATPEVRSFGELFTHVAGAEAMFCAMALGEKPPAEDAVKATTRAAILAALDASAKSCDAAYAM